FSGNLNAGIRGVPYTTSYRYTGLSRVESPCYTNPEDRRKEAEKLRDRARTHLPQGILAYSLGDENTLAVSHVDVCMSPTCQEDFREYLRRVYGTLAALNAEWGAAYKAWSEVAPMTEKEAQERGNLAPFIDHRLHMDDVFAGIHLFAQDVLHEIDPKTPVGPEGLWNTGPLRGFHWTKFARNLGVVNVYTDEYLKREIIRSLAPRQALHGMWYGGYEHDVDAPERMARLPWMMLLHDQNSVWWYSVRSYSHIGSCLGAFAPDLRPMPYFERTLAEWDTLHRGAAKLIMSLPRLHDGLAVLYSRPSAYAFGLGTEDLLAALEDAGYQYDVVSDEDLAQAPPDPRKYRALILPNCRALSEAEARHVEAFAVAGGLVIADLLPGLYDEHAKLRPSGRLNDLFGVASMNATVRQEETSAVFEAMTIPLLATGECAVAAGSPRAKLADGRPAIITREHDKGRAVYLNFSLEGYRHERQKESLPTLARLLQQLLVGHGVMPPVQVSDAHGQPVPRCEVCRYGDERMQLVGILREVGKGPEVVTATIKLPVKGHVYDVRRRKYLGQSDSLDVPLGPVEVFAALPYRVTGIPPRRISGPQNARPGAAVALQAQVRADGPTVGTHVL
ncbi:MAG: hypothetical protein FJ279_34855, partial [Planctomycetes bacterium]|nr:hypothetical protein [Planctomycetota bacterium]